MNRLAIIIPAYKNDFFEKVLISLENQTCKDFVVYIGDDCSPYDLETIVNKHRNSLEIVFHRFNYNLGRENLVAQWERCIRLSKKEDWIWLFSDDDILEANCVECFYNTINETKSYYDVYHFDVKCIDSNDSIISLPSPYPSVISSYDFYRKKMSGKIISFVVENVFSRKVWEKTNGFQNFDLAWGSDTASWMKFCQYSGMCSIRGAFVLWRKSEVNISPNVREDVVIRKINALLTFYEWTNTFFIEDNIFLKWTNISSFLMRMRNFKKYVPQGIIQESTRRFCLSQSISFLYYLLYNYIRYR